MMDVIVDQIPGEIAWKDLQFRYLGCNRLRASKIPITHPELIIGLKDDDLSDQTEVSIRFHRRHDELALQGKTIKTIQLSFTEKNRVAYFQTKKPLYLNEQLTGIIYHCDEYTKPDVINRLYQIDKAHFPSTVLSAYYEIEAQTNPFQLSKREMECVFYMLRGMSANMISRILHLSKRTVESYIDTIKSKAHCQSKAELMTQLIVFGYSSVIPGHLLGIDLRSFLS